MCFNEYEPLKHEYGLGIMIHVTFTCKISDKYLIQGTGSYRYLLHVVVAVE